MLRRDCSGKCIEWIEGHCLVVVVEVYIEQEILVRSTSVGSDISYFHKQTK